MELYLNKEQCCGCTACMNICPKHAITMQDDKEGFLYPVISREDCIECGLCKKVCAFQQSKTSKSTYKQEVYAFKYSDTVIREDSTSGGAFTAISDYIIADGGVVYGAVYDMDFNVHHKRATNKKECELFRGSKYVQSKLTDTFSKVKYDLSQGRKVLFTGTPCQNAALKRYISEKERENLYLCEIVCHGVPSPLIWEEYKNDMEKRFNDTIKKVNFRSKKLGWHKSTMHIQFSNNDYIGKMGEDPFYIMFFKHFSLRPSCHICKYASYEREADLTIADFWGIENTNLNMDDEKGVSLVIINSEKGKEVLNYLSSEHIIKQSNLVEAYQPVLEEPSKANKFREEFWEDYYKNGYLYVKDKYATMKLKDKVFKNIIVPTLHKLGVYQLLLKIYFRLMKGKNKCK